MIITEIREQKNGRFAIYADGQYIMSADANTLGLSNLRKGMEISPQELETFAKAAQEQFAKDKAFTFLSYRDHTKEELRRKLLRSVDDETADSAAQKMVDLGLVNDETYAEKFACELLNIKLFGADRAIYEMTRRGLDRELARETVEQLDTNPHERIKRFINKKFPRGFADEKERRRAVAALSRYGFKWDEIREALRDYDEDD